MLLPTAGYSCLCQTQAIHAFADCPCFLAPLTPAACQGSQLAALPLNLACELAVRCRCRGNLSVRFREGSVTQDVHPRLCNKDVDATRALPIPEFAKM